jgi:hypothetical protein
MEGCDRNVSVIQPCSVGWLAMAPCSDCRSFAVAPLHLLPISPANTSIKTVHRSGQAVWLLMTIFTMAHWRTCVLDLAIGQI